MKAVEIWHELEKRYSVTIDGKPEIEPFCLMIYDGLQVAHIITSYTIWENELQFQDPWPGNSLLCKENNMAGVNARRSNVIKPGWRITSEEFQRVIYAAIPTVRKLIPLNEEERQAAEQESRMMNLLRQFNNPNSPSLKGIFPNIKTFSELESAVRMGQTWRVKMALNKGVDINEKFSEGTPLHSAAAQGNMNIVRLLVEQGADLLALDSHGNTPAKVAEHNRHLQIANYLRSLNKMSKKKTT